MVATKEGTDTVFTGIYDSGEIIGTYLGATPSYSIYCTDMQGSTSVLNNSSLDISGGYSYSDYGEVTPFDGTPTQNEVCYTGAVYDGTTGEHYLRARYYDPEQGVFTAQDTLRGEATDEALWNSYAYCNGDPVNNCDPSGHVPISMRIIEERYNLKSFRFEIQYQEITSQEGIAIKLWKASFNCYEHSKKSKKHIRWLKIRSMSIGRRFNEKGKLIGAGKEYKKKTFKRPKHGKLYAFYISAKHYYGVEKVGTCNVVYDVGCYKLNTKKKIHKEFTYSSGSVAPPIPKGR